MDATQSNRSIHGILTHRDIKNLIYLPGSASLLNFYEIPVSAVRNVLYINYQSDFRSDINQSIALS